MSKLTYLVIVCIVFLIAYVSFLLVFFPDLQGQPSKPEAAPKNQTNPPENATKKTLEECQKKSSLEEKNPCLISYAVASGNQSVCNTLEGSFEVFGTAINWSKLCNDEFKGL